VVCVTQAKIMVLRNASFEFVMKIKAILLKHNKKEKKTHTKTVYGFKPG